MTTYLLPCECSAELAVTAGQAGGRVTCRQCGREVAVPKLGQLARLRRREMATEPGHAAWRPAKAVAFLGAIVCAGSLLAALWIAPRAKGVLDEQALRAAVRSVDDLAVYRVWSEGLSRVGVRRPPSEEELALIRQTRFADGVRGLLHIVAAGGAIATLAAGFRLAAGSKPSASALQPATKAPRAGAGTDRP